VILKKKDVLTAGAARGVAGTAAGFAAKTDRRPGFFNWGGGLPTGHIWNGKKGCRGIVMMA